MRVLVTGHHGYLGSVLMPLLAGAGHEATGLDSDLFERCLLGGEPEAETWRSVRKDLRDVTPLETISAGLLIGSIVLMGIWWSLFTDRLEFTILNLPGVTG